MYIGRPSVAGALWQGWGMSILERGLVFSGRYHVVGTLGDGGMARVYKAIDMRLGRTVAVKVLHPYYNNQAVFVTRFEQEARLAASLNHPHIMGVYDVGCDDDGSHYIVMEYVEGDTLKRLIARDAPLALPTAAAILRQIGLALDDAHAHGVIHRDVKPENIFLTPARTVKVGDFGIARALDANTLTPTGMVLGSVSYLAPEQALGQRATGQSDIYATGIVLYEMLTGRLPFVAENALGVAMMHLNENPLPPSHHTPSLPPAVDAVVLTALVKDPAGRYHTGTDLADALDRANKTGATTTITVAIPPAAVASAPIPVPGVASARPLAMEPDHPVGTRPAPRPVVDPNAASTSHRLDDGTWASLPAARHRAPHGRASGVVAVSVPVRVAAPAHRRRALIPLVVPLLALLAVGGIIKATVGGHDGRYGASVGAARTPTVTTTRTTRTAAATATGRSYAVIAVPPAHTATLGDRHMPVDATPTTFGRATTGGMGAAANARGRRSATSTATPPRVRATGDGAPVMPVATPPAQATPTATDVPSYTYVPVAPVRRAPARVGPTQTPATPVTDTPTSQPTDTPTSQPTDTPTSQPTDTPAPQPTDTLLPSPSATVAVSSQGAVDTATVAPPPDARTPVNSTGAAAPTSISTSPPPTDTPVAATTLPAPSGDQGAPSVFNLGNVVVSAQALDAVYYANTVYMQVMNERDTRNVDSAFGPALASTNRGVAATLAATSQHWNIRLIDLSLAHAQVIDGNTVRVTVTKSENAQLLSDAGRVIKPTYTDTETFVDLVQRIGGRWLVTQVYH